MERAARTRPYKFSRKRESPSLTIRFVFHREKIFLPLYKWNSSTNTNESPTDRFCGSVYVRVANGSIGTRNSLDIEILRNRLCWYARECSYIMSYVLLRHDRAEWVCYGMEWNGIAWNGATRSWLYAIRSAVPLGKNSRVSLKKKNLATTI